MAFDNKIVFDTVRVMIKKYSTSFVTFDKEDIRLLDNAIMIGQMGTVPKPNPGSSSTVPTDSGFRLSTQSMKQLEGVLPALRKCVELAIKYSAVDFRVLEGVRTLERQKEYVKKGASKTLKSKHLVQPDGYGHAVDLVAVVNGKVSWDFDEYYYIARAMDRAATELGLAGNIRWGAAWDRVLSDFGSMSNDKVEARKEYIKAVEDYKKRHAGSDFLDGPHFEWVA